MLKKENQINYSFHIFVSFSDIFPDEELPDVRQILSHYSRRSLLNASLVLENLYAEKEFSECDKFFSPENKDQYREIMRRFSKFRSSRSDVSYYFSSFVTGLEILRHAYSLPLKETDDYNPREYEWELFRAILIINQNTICRFHAIEGIRRYQLVYLNNLCYVDIGNNMKTFAIQQCVYAYEFFTFLSVHSQKTRALLSEFETHYEASWKRYVLSLNSAFFLSLKYKGRLDKDLHIDKDRLMDACVLDKITMPLMSTKILKYASESKDDRTGNSDYRFFRELPIIETDDYYVLYSSSMILGKIYNSLFFDLPKFNKQITDRTLRINNVSQLIQVDFIQNTLLTGLICKINPHKYSIHTEMMMERRHKKRDDELGPPDLFVQAPNYVILFECKDIHLNGWIKEQKDFSLIITELEEKILGSKADDHKGVGQLTGHMKSIRDGSFPWAKVSRGKKVYPVLVLSDPNLIQEGFYGIANDKFNESLRNKGVRNISANRPLIVMSPVTLIKYESNFKKKGLVFYFEKYYRFLKETKFYEVSFEHFMSGKKFNQSKLILRIISEIKQKS